MIRMTIALAVAATVAGAAAPTPDARPAITGISHLAVYSTDLTASDHFYASILGAKKGPDPEDAAGARYYVNPRQFVEVLPAPAHHGPSMLAHVAYTTVDAAALRAWLTGQGVSGLSPVQRNGDDRWFSGHDPEGNEVQFVQPGTTDTAAVPGAISGRIIHVGYLVHDRAREDGFYKRLLGFRPYWYGAMKADAVDWISQQVPDGPDWLEYMMVGPGSTTPVDHVEARELGVLDHVSLGVPNMEAAVTRLIAEHRLPPRHDGPQMGLDGKWQANLYDPDGTRIELMEFQPVTMPCCSPFTAASPTK
jgi:catechol 2,3-dioxygenase-like lactoylglutathione lyase family enzyme